MCRPTSHCIVICMPCLFSSPLTPARRPALPQSHPHDTPHKKVTTPSVKRCHQYGAAGHVFCHCERSLNLDPDSVIRQNMHRFDEQRCEFLTTSAFILKKGLGRGRRHGVEPKQTAHHKSIKAVKKAYKKHKCSSIHESWTTEYIFSPFLPLVLML